MEGAGYRVQRRVLFLRTGAPGRRGDRHYLRQAKWAAKKLRLEERTAFKQISVYALAVMDEKYDLIFFMGVFYHLRYPLLALDTVASKVRQLMVFQTVTMPGGRRRTHRPISRWTSATGSPQKDGRRWPLLNAHSPAIPAAGGLQITPESWPCCAPPA